MMLLLPLTANAQNFVYLEYAPVSNHLSDGDAPAGGYNEDNNIVTFKFGREFTLNDNWNYNFTAGVTAFENSYYKSSKGAGIGAEMIYKATDEIGLYGGADLGLVDGYEGNVDDDYIVFGDYVPFLALNGGAEYDFGAQYPSIRGGIKYIPASIAGSDDVVAYTIGTRYKF